MPTIVINDLSPRNQYTATNAQTTFTYTFPIVSNSDLLVYKYAAGATANDATAILTLTTDYTVTGAGSPTGGTVVLNVGATTGDIVTIARYTPENRLGQYLDGATLTAEALNSDFNDQVLFAQQNYMFTRKVAPQYNTSAVINNDTDLKLPILGANQTWMKNTGNTAITTTTIPTYPVGAAASNTGTLNHVAKWNGTGTLILADSGVVIDGSNNVTGVTSLAAGNVSISGNTVTNGSSNLLLTGTSNVKISGITYPNTDGTSGQVLYTNGSGVLAFTSVPNLPSPSTNNAIAKFSGTAGQLQNSGVIIDASNNMSGGTWQGTVVAGTYGGTGVNNGASTITIGGNVTFTGAFTSAFTFTGNTAVTFPTSGTLATTAGTVSSVSGTANRITSTGGTTPVIDISASYVGQSSITTLGTIGTGVWQGTVVGSTYGGTGVNNGSNTITIGGNLSTAAAHTLSGAFASTFTFTGATSVTFPTSGTICTTVGSSSIVTVGTITSGTWNGTAVDVAHGGTGNASATAYAVQCGGTTTTGAFQSVSGVGTSGQVLTSNGAGALPTWQSVIANAGEVTKTITQTAHGFSVGNVLIYNGTSFALAKADTAANAEAVGIVVTVNDVNTFVLLLSGYISGLSGLVAGTVYFLSPTSAGALTATAPTTINQVNKPLLIADTTTSGYFNNMRGNVVGTNNNFAALQRVSSLTGAVATGSTTIPFDNTIPQNTEGDQYMSLAITPVSATSILVIDVVVNAGTSEGTSQVFAAALFQDTTANALAATYSETASSVWVQNLKFTHIMTSGTTSSTTFKVRAGGAAAGTTTFNGSAGAGIYNGVMASSIKITEYSS